MRLKVLERCLLSGQPALSTYPATQSVQILDAWLKPLLEEVAWELSRGVAGAADRAEELAGWLDDTAQHLKGADELSSKQLAECLKAALKSLRSMLDKPNSSQAVKRAGSKYTTVEPLHSSCIAAAAAKQPALAGHVSSAAAGGSSSSSSSGSPYAADISSQLASSAARPNQLQAFEQLNAYFTDLSGGRPAEAQLAAAMQAKYGALCSLRAGVCKLLLSGTKNDAPGGSWAACQRQLDAWLVDYAAAYAAEQQLMGQEGAWPNIAAGVVEPTGAGKTGIINLAPFAALGPLAPAGSTCKVLVVTPNLAIRTGVFDSFSKHSGKSCLRDVLKITSHPELLPTAFDLSALPGVASAAVETAAAAAAATTAAAGKAGSSASKVASGSGRTSNNGGVAAAVAAAAAVALEADEDDGDAEDGYADFEDGDMDEDLMNNAAAAAGFGTDEAAGHYSSYAGGSSSKSTAPAIPAGLSGPLRQLAEADVVVANIQQLSVQKLEKLFSRDYFDLIIMDEAHHAAARTWGAVLDYFAAAAKVLLTATPFRGDRAQLPMVVVTGDAAALRIKERIRQGLCSNMAYAPVPVSSVQVAEAGSSTVETYSGREQLQQLSERYDIQKVALDDAAVREATMRYSMQLAQKLRNASGQRHTIIAQAGGKEDAENLCQQWRELSLTEFGGRFSVDYTHSEASAEHQARVEALAKAGTLDVVIHVGQLGEGFDAPALSVVAVFRVFRSMAPFMQLLGRAARRIPAIPATHPANVAFLVAHPLLGYHKHWQVYCEERQDFPRELNARGRASNVRLVSFAYPPEAAANGPHNGPVQAGSSSAGASAAAAAASRVARSQAAGLPGPEEVSYMVHPSEIAGSDRAAAPLAPAAAAPAAGPVMPAAATATVTRRAAVAAASPVPHVGPRQQLQQQLRLLAGPRASACKLAELRSIISGQKCLGHITTSGKGRDTATVQAEVAAALQQMLTGGGALSYQHLKQQQQRLLIPGIGMKDLKQVRNALDPWLSHVKLSGQGRTIDAVRSELLQAVHALIELQGLA